MKKLLCVFNLKALSFRLVSTTREIEENKFRLNDPIDKYERRVRVASAGGRKIPSVVEFF